MARYSYRDDDEERRKGARMYSGRNGRETEGEAGWPGLARPIDAGGRPDRAAATPTTSLPHTYHLLVSQAGR